MWISVWPEVKSLTNQMASSGYCQGQKEAMFPPLSPHCWQKVQLLWSSFWSHQLNEGIWSLQDQAATQSPLYLHHACYPASLSSTSGGLGQPSFLSPCPLVGGSHVTHLSCRSSLLRLQPFLSNHYWAACPSSELTWSLSDLPSFPHLPEGTSPPSSCTRCIKLKQVSALRRDISL